MRIWSLSAVAALAISSVTTSAHAITVTPMTSGSDLVQTLLGSGISYSNVVYQGATGASGTFASGGNIGLGSGVLLTSGSVQSALPPNIAQNTSFNNGVAGNAQLNTLIPSGFTQDASVLSFDFTTTSGDLYFQYVFASEEYNEYVGSSFNDVFGFFVDGQNIAVIPSTTTPVAINNVNLNNNSAYYVNNSPGTVQTGYDGLTTVLTAAVTGLSAGTHNIVLAVADVGDSIYDSAVFLGAGTFSATNPGGSTVPELDPAAGASAALLLLLGVAMMLGRRRSPQLLSL